MTVRELIAVLSAHPLGKDVEIHTLPLPGKQPLRTRQIAVRPNNMAGTVQLLAVEPLRREVHP